MLACSKCDAPHDLDLAPDEGTCVVCGGALVEDEKERALVTGFSAIDAALVGAVADGLAAVAVVRGKAPRGED